MSGRGVTEAERVLGETRSVLLVDWPSRDVPDTLACHGFTVVSADGPGESDYSAYEYEAGDSVRVRGGGRRPERADLVYARAAVAPAIAAGSIGVQLSEGFRWCRAPSPVSRWPSSPFRSRRGEFLCRKVRWGWGTGV